MLLATKSVKSCKIPR